jgi:hypothetical protein
MADRASLTRAWNTGSIARMLAAENFLVSTLR